MKRKLLATLLALCLIVGMIPVAASADSTTDCLGGDTCTHAAAIGDTHYDTLQEAIDAVSANENNHVIEVLRNLQPEDVGAEKQEMRFTKEGQSVTLELNQHEITTAYEEAIHINAANVTLTIQNGTIRNYYNIGNYSDGLYAFQNSNNLTLTLDNVTLDSRTQTLAVQGLTSNSNVTIRNSTLNSDEQLGIYYPPKSGVLTIENSVITAGTGVVVKGGTVNILGEETKIVTDGNKVVPEDYYTGATDGSSSLTMTGDALYVESGYNDRDIVVNVQNGTLKSTNSYAIQMFVKTDEEVAVKRDVAVSGGTFSSDVSEYVADGYTMVESDDEYVVEPLGPGNSVAQVGENYFDSLEEAISKAESGDTVVLLKSTTGNGNIYISDGREITLNLNGFNVGFAQNGKINLTHGILNLMGRGMLYEEEPYYAPVMLYGAKTDQADYTVITVGEDVILQGWSGLFVDYNEAQKAYGVKATVYGTLNSVRDYTGAGGHAFYINGTIKDTDGNVPEFILDGATLNTEDGNGMYLAGYAKTTITDSTIISNSEDSTGIEIRAGELEITDSTIIGGNGEYTEAPNGNGSTSSNVALAVTQHTTKLPIKITVNSGTFSANAAFVQANPQENGPEDIDKVTLEINGGDFNGLVYSENKTKFISGGNFTHDPSEYLAEGKVAVESDEPGYNYMVAEANTEAPAEVVTAEPDANVSESITGEEDKEAAKAIQSALDANVVSGDGLTAAANTVAKNNTVTTNPEVLKQLNKVLPNGSEEATADNTTIVIQPYMDISIDAVAMAAKTVTLDITPMYRTVATTAKLESGQIILDSKDSGTVNAVQIGDPRPLEINKPVTITLTLPANFATSNETLYIQHIKDGGRTYYYTGTVDTGTVDSKNLTFTNPNGFSTFTVSTTNGAVAEVEGIGYANFQDAVDAVENGGTINVLKSGDYSVSGNKTFSITYETGIAVTLKAATGYVLTQEGNNTYTIAYAGGGTPSEPEEPTWPFTDVTEGDDWFYDAVAYVYENGIMAGTGETTFAPYMELDRAMAAQLFYNLEGKPAVTGDSTFTDVTSGHWAVDAITWAAQNDIVAGIGGDLYDPDSNVTREQFAVMLYKYARFKGYDLTATGDLTQFPDAGSISSWAETALSWANGKGLINGHENGTIDPKGSTIRAQAASIMANFDQNVAK